jgi:SRSO17 transposase
MAAEVFAPLARDDQRLWAGRYVRGLLGEGRRKSVEPMAERLGIPRQNLGRFVAQSTWDYREVMRRVAARAHRVLRPSAWLIDDRNFVRWGLSGGSRRRKRAVPHRRR